MESTKYFMRFFLSIILLTFLSVPLSINIQPSNAQGQEDQKEEQPKEQGGIIGAMKKVGKDMMEGDKKDKETKEEEDTRKSLPDACKENPNSQACKDALDAIEGDIGAIDDKTADKDKEYIDKIDEINKAKETLKKCKTDECREAARKKLQKLIDEGSKIVSDRSKLKQEKRKKTAQIDMINKMGDDARKKGKTVPVAGGAQPKVPDAASPGDTADKGDKSKKGEDLEKDSLGEGKEAKQDDLDKQKSKIGNLDKQITKKDDEFKKARDEIKDLEKKREACGELSDGREVAACRDKYDRKIELKKAEAGRITAERRKLVDKRRGKAEKLQSEGVVTPNEPSRMDAIIKKGEEASSQRMKAINDAARKAEEEEEVRKQDVHTVYDEDEKFFYLEKGPEGDTSGWTTVQRKNDEGKVVFSETRDAKGNFVESYQLFDNGKALRKSVDWRGVEKTTVIDENNKRVGSELFNPRLEERTLETYEGGLIKYSTTTDKENRKVASFQRYDKGNPFDLVHTIEDIDYDKGLWTTESLDTDGSVFVTHKDLEGNLINEFGVMGNGSQYKYVVGGDAESALAEGEIVSKSDIASYKEYITGKRSGTHKFRHKDEDALNKKLLAFKDGKGDSVIGGDVIVSSRFQEFQESHQQESDKGENASDSETINMHGEIRDLNTNGNYRIKGTGASAFKGSGYGNTPAEAMSSALREAASSIQIHVESEMVNHRKSNQETRGGKLTQWSHEQHVWKESSTNTFVTIKDYKVTKVTEIKDPDTGQVQYEVSLEAQPGVALRNRATPPNFK
ncbi:MAG: hypothetical protein ACE5GV_10965 [Candidatus Scalindua sp.]